GERSGAGSQRWTAAARLQAVIAAAAMDEATRSAWCREQGLYPAELDAWKQDAIAGLGEPRAASAAEAREDRRRVKELERQLHRKDKALAETAALLVLSKKLAAVLDRCLSHPLYVGIETDRIADLDRPQERDVRDGDRNGTPSDQPR